MGFKVHFKKPKDTVQQDNKKNKDKTIEFLNCSMPFPPFVLLLCALCFIQVLKCFSTTLLNAKSHWKDILSPHISYKGHYSEWHLFNSYIVATGNCQNTLYPSFTPVCPLFWSLPAYVPIRMDKSQSIPWNYTYASKLNLFLNI